MTIHSHRQFRAAVAELRADGADDQTTYDTLAALMDRRGVPMMLLQEYANDPTIVRLFADRGVRLLTPEEMAGGKIGDGL